MFLTEEQAYRMNLIFQSDMCHGLSILFERAALEASREEHGKHIHPAEFTGVPKVLYELSESLHKIYERDQEKIDKAKRP